MRQNWGKLISRLGLSFAGSIAVSAGAVSIFIGTSKGDSKQPNQVVQPKNNTTTQGNNSPAIQGSSNTTTINSGNTTNNSHNTTNHTQTDKRSQPTINCNGGTYNKGVCGSVNTMNNH